MSLDVAARRDIRPGCGCKPLVFQQVLSGQEFVGPIVVVTDRGVLVWCGEHGWTDPGVARPATVDGEREEDR